MTRFARAKGSKASNERLPEESTSWATMKQQLLENISNSKNQGHEKRINEEKIANYQKFLKEKEEEESKHSVWASFPVQRNKSLLLNNKLKKTIKKNKMASKNGEYNKDFSKDKKKIIEKKLKLVINKERKMKDTIIESENSENNSNNIEKEKKKGKSKLLNNHNKVKSNITQNDTGQLKKIVKKDTSISNDNNKKEQNTVIKVNDTAIGKKKKGKKRKCEELGKLKIEKATKKMKKNKAELTEIDLKKIEKKKQKKIKQLLKKKQFKETMKQNDEKVVSATIHSDETQTGVDESTITKIENFPTKNIETKREFNKSQQKQKGPLKDKKKKNLEMEQKRKKTLPHKMFINGKELEIAYVEGFPVKKDDAERLKKLRKEMISKGLPRSQIDTALKLERRRAEKSLAREKKKVCFNCRKSGHNLSECAELGKNQLIETTGSGICFKCGSAEHTHFECKVVRGQEYKFAQCFICNEQGHIARQCPDNARGLYPKGGACKVCGDVTHLKKDCPQYQSQEKQENSLRIQTLGDSNPEMLDGSSENSTSTSMKKQNRIIKFV